MNTTRVHPRDAPKQARCPEKGTNECGTPVLMPHCAVMCAGPIHRGVEPPAPPTQNRVARRTDEKTARAGAYVPLVGVFFACPPSFPARRAPRCRGCSLTLETNGLKARHFQGVETESFQHEVNLKSTCTALPRRPLRPRRRRAVGPCPPPPLVRFVCGLCLGLVGLFVLLRRRQRPWRSSPACCDPSTSYRFNSSAQKTVVAFRRAYTITIK